MSSWAERKHGVGKNESARVHAANVRASQRFALLMREAISNGTENPLIGMQRKPCTDRPRYTPAQALPISRTGSPAAMCSAEVVN